MTTANRWLAGAALALGAAGVVVGAGGREPGGVGVAELSAELAEGAPLLDALELARWIRGRRPVRILDLRDSTAFGRLAIPLAENVPFAGLAASVHPSDEVVLYDDGSGDAVRGWLLLRRLGHERVHVLRGGILGWVDGVLSPVMPMFTPEQKRRFDEVAEVSRYFGGVPRVGVPDRAGGPVGTEEAIRLITRRGCY